MPGPSITPLTYYGQALGDPPAPYPHGVALPSPSSACNAQRGPLLEGGRGWQGSDLGPDHHLRPSLKDALAEDSSHKIYIHASKQIVDGKVVSETTETKALK